MNNEMDSLLVTAIHTMTSVYENDATGESMPFLRVEMKIEGRDDTVSVLLSAQLAVGLIIAAGRMLHVMMGVDSIDVPDATSTFTVEDIINTPQSDEASDEESQE